MTEDPVIEFTGPPTIRQRLEEGKKFPGWEHYAMSGDPNYHEACEILFDKRLNQGLPTFMDCVRRIRKRREIQ